MEIDRLVADVLEHIIADNQRQMRRNAISSPFVKFQSSYVPEVSVASYLQRIRRYSKCSDSCLIMTLVYVDRAVEARGLVLSALNIHRLLIVSVMLAAKFHEDLFYNNAFYAQLGGLTLSELNVLEVELLHLLNFSLHVDTTTFANYSQYLQGYATQRYAPRPPSPLPMLCPLQQCSPRGVATAANPFSTSVVAAGVCDNAFQFSPFAVHKHISLSTFSPPEHHQQAMQVGSYAGASVPISAVSVSVPLSVPIPMTLTTLPIVYPSISFSLFNPGLGLGPYGVAEDPRCYMHRAAPSPVLLSVGY